MNERQLLWCVTVTEVDSNNCVVCLPTWVVPSTSAPLDTGNMSYFQTCCASLPDFPFFHSSPPPLSLLGRLYVGQRWAVNGVLNRLWTGPTSPTSIFCPHPSQRLFPPWLFLTPCAISLPDLHSISESVWLARQFHRTAHAKRAPERGGLLVDLLLIQFVAPLRSLSKLWRFANATVALQDAALVNTLSCTE